jgi:hypothetical protein
MGFAHGVVCNTTRVDCNVHTVDSSNPWPGHHEVIRAHIDSAGDARPEPAHDDAGSERTKCCVERSTGALSSFACSYPASSGRAWAPSCWRRARASSRGWGRPARDTPLWIDFPSVELLHPTGTCGSGTLSASGNVPVVVSHNRGLGCSSTSWLWFRWRSPGGSPAVPRTVQRISRQAAGGPCPTHPTRAQARVGSRAKGALRQEEVRAPQQQEVGEVLRGEAQGPRRVAPAGRREAQARKAGGSHRSRLHGNGSLTPRSIPRSMQRYSTLTCSTMTRAWCRRCTRRTTR